MAPQGLREYDIYFYLFIFGVVTCQELFTQEQSVLTSGSRTESEYWKLTCRLAALVGHPCTMAVPSKSFSDFAFARQSDRVNYTWLLFMFDYVISSSH
jgi:hypothetical protein